MGGFWCLPKAEEKQKCHVEANCCLLQEISEGVQGKAAGHDDALRRKH